MKILVIGDSCRDVFIYGKCERLCPEAPVPVLVPTKTKKNGGMALNVYENLKSLGVDVDIITNKEKMDKTRYVDEKTNQIIVRVDSNYSKFERVKNLDKIDFTLYDAVIISDYNKGFLEYDDIKFICSNHEMVFVDTKKIVNDFFENVFILKLNEHEYEYNIKNNNYLDKLRDKLIITLGARGCKYKNKIYDVEKVEIKDLSGAGDTFISSLVYKYILTNNINQSIRFANQCSTIVVQQKGVNKVGDFLN
jgi:bifunctional ADP-heptose synthase (sugar kinase/adenylyltransferase)